MNRLWHRADAELKVVTEQLDGHVWVGAAGVRQLTLTLYPFHWVPELFGVPMSRVKRWNREGRLPVDLVGGCAYVGMDLLDEFANEFEQPVVRPGSVRYSITEKGRRALLEGA